MLSKKLFSLCLFILSILVFGSFFAYADNTESNGNIKPSLQVVPGKEHFIYIKFSKAFGVQLNDAIPSPGYNNSDMPSQFTTPNAKLKDLVTQVTNTYALKFSKAIKLPDAELAKLETEANQNFPLRPQAYLFRTAIKITLPNPSAENTKSVAEALMPFADYVYIGIQSAEPPPPPVDIPPTTPDLKSLQLHWSPDPGLDFQYAQNRGITGSVVRFSDCEYGWNLQHEDLMDQSITRQADDNPAIWSFIDHGTAALGCSAAGVNGYGMDGAAPQAQFFVYSEVNNRRLESITRAINNSRPGDIVLLEMQDTGPDSLLAPAEINPLVWDVVRAGVDKGVVVVAAAGNGHADLDSAPYTEYRNRGDSGSIIVGAGTSSVSHDRLSFSTYGTRVNVQAWGENVATLGYGTLTYGGDTNQEYTLTFNGTSSASALTSAASAVIQSYMESRYFDYLEPLEMRNLLMNTGHPQGTASIATPIGPAVNIRAAIESIDNDTQAPDAPLNLTATLVNTTVTLAWNRATDNIGIHEYRIYRNGMFIGSTTMLTFQNAGLLPGTYSYQIRAVDFNGNISAFSNTATVTISQPAAISLDYCTYNSSPQSSTIYVNFCLHNNGTGAINLSDCTVKYWYTYEAFGAETTTVDWAGRLPSGQAITSSVSRNIATISQGGQTRVMTVSFSGGAGTLQPGEYAEVKIRINKFNWSNYTQTNDYSFGTNGNYLSWTKITGYYQNVLNCGIEP